MNETKKHWRIIIVREQSAAQIRVRMAAAKQWFFRTVETTTHERQEKFDKTTKGKEEQVQKQFSDVCCAP